MADRRRSGGGSFDPVRVSPRAIERGRGYSAPVSVSRSQGGYAQGWRPGNNDISRYPSNQGPEDPMDRLARIIAMFDSSNTAGGGGSGNIDAAFAGQYAGLDAARGDLQRRFDRGNADIGAMYEALAKGINAREGEVAANYDNSINDIGEITSTASEGIIGGQEKLAAQQAALLQRLGIEAAAPDMTDAATAANAGNIAIQQDGAAANRMLTSNRATAVDFNKTQANIAGLEGRNRQSDLLSQLMSRQAELDAQRGQIDSQRAQARLSMQGQAAGNNDEMTRFFISTALDQLNRGDDMAAKQSAAASEGLSPYARVYGEALGQLGARGAETAMGILNAAGASGMGNTQAEWINKVMSTGKNSGISPQHLAFLASSWWAASDPRAPQLDQSKR